ncbi:MAG TPA: hypothetical protein VFB34_02935, partial [Chloroflexota bacterium]|nr:hypothetical protein [Chloroflexota bacterium]
MPDLRIPAAFGLSSRTRWLQGLTVREAVRSAVLSARHHAWHEGRPLIVASPGSAIECHPTAKLDSGGPLSLGHWPTGPPSALPALVQLGADSVLKVRGWAVFAGGSVVVVGPGAVLDLAGC